MKADKIIALDIGEDYIRMGVFARRSGQLELLDHGRVAVESNPHVEMTREAVVATALKRLLDEKKPATRKAVISIEGPSVFSRLVRLPPVAPDKVEQTIRHEAVQNIPFPIDEVVWDAHVVDAAVVEPEVMLVAVKAELVDGLVHAVNANGLLVERVDVAPAALANAARFIYPNSAEPMLLVDIGSVSTNLVFMDGDRTFFRTLSFNVETLPRLIQEIERSIMFYRGQQGGNAPQRIFLTGVPVSTEEFQSQLGIPAGELDLRQIVKQDTAGLAILAGMVVLDASPATFSLNLIPVSLQAARSLQRRQPWWLACAVLVVLVFGVWIWGLKQMSVLTQQENAAVTARIQALEKIENELLPLEHMISKLEGQSEIYCTAIRQRTFMLEVLEDLRGCLPEGMFLLSSEPLSDVGKGKGLRVSVVSYLDKESEGQDAVKLLRDRLRKNDHFSDATKVSSRPTKKLFARQFILDIYFEEALLK